MCYLSKPRVCITHTLLFVVVVQALRLIHSTANHYRLTQSIEKYQDKLFAFWFRYSGAKKKKKKHSHYETANSLSGGKKTVSKAFTENEGLRLNGFITTRRAYCSTIQLLPFSIISASTAAEVYHGRKPVSPDK